VSCPNLPDGLLVVGGRARRDAAPAAGAVRRHSYRRSWLSVDALAALALLVRAVPEQLATLVIGDVIGACEASYAVGLTEFGTTQVGGTGSAKKASLGPRLVSRWWGMGPVVQIMTT